MKKQIIICEKGIIKQVEQETEYQSLPCKCNVSSSNCCHTSSISSPSNNITIKQSGENWISLSDNDDLSLKDIWENLYRCRDLELNSLWSRSAFLWTLIALAFTAYGCFIVNDSPLIRPSSPNGKIIGLILSYIIYILGVYGSHRV